MNGEHLWWRGREKGEGKEGSAQRKMEKGVESRPESTNELKVGLYYLTLENEGRRVSL